MEDSPSPSKRKCYEHQTNNSETSDISRNLFSRHAALYHPHTCIQSQIRNNRYDNKPPELTTHSFIPMCYNPNISSTSQLPATTCNSDLTSQNKVQQLSTSYWDTYHQLYGNFLPQFNPNSSSFSSDKIISNYADLTVTHSSLNFSNHLNSTGTRNDKMETASTGTSMNVNLPIYAESTAVGNNKVDVVSNKNVWNKHFQNYTGSLVTRNNKINVASTGTLSNQYFSNYTVSTSTKNKNHLITSDPGKVIPKVEIKDNDMSKEMVSFQTLPRNYSVTELPVTSVGGKFLAFELELAEELQRLQFTLPVTHIYNPLEYAVDVHGAFLKRFCTGIKQVLFLGMNPGPYGMVQTGVPFGEISLVRDWLQICGEVKKPFHEHPKRPVLGFDCKRSEVSGARFWGYFKSTCITPEQFFKNCFVYNMCPLVFMNQNGKNLTPPDLNVNTRNQLNMICDKYLCKIVELLKVKTVVGVGNFAQKRAMKALSGLDVDVKVIMHPSPANPTANKGWNAIVEKQLNDIGVSKYL